MIKLCVICGKEFDGRNRRKTDSEECSAMLHKVRMRAWWRSDKGLACARVRRSKPEYKEWQRNYQTTETCMERRRAYHQRPEIKARRYAYCKTTEFLTRRRARYLDPKVKAKRKEYRKRPEVRVRTNALQRSPKYRELKNRWRADNPLNSKQRQAYSAKRRADRQILGDHYVRTALQLVKSICPPELIALKREQLKLRRLLKEIKHQ